MSYNRAHPDSQHSSGGGGRDWEHYRDRPPSRSAHGGNESGVVRDRRRAMSNDRDARNLPPTNSSDMRSHSRSHHSRWPYDVRNRGGTVSGASTEAERSRDWDRSSRRGREHLGIARHSSNNRDAAYSEGVMPPSLSSRHTTSSFARSRGPIALNTPPQFGRRATQPGESLEEGELELEDRNSSSHPRSTSGRAYAMPADPGVHIRRSDTHSSIFRGDRRSPMPSTSVLPPTLHYGTQSRDGRVMDRKYSYSSHKSDSRHQSRATTPSPKRQHAKSIEIVRTPSPVPLPGRLPPTNSTSIVSRAIKVEPKGLVAAGTISRATQPKSEPVGGSRTPSPRAITPEPIVPKQHLQSRISDIDREIAECEERLVQISGNRIYTEPGDSSTIAQQPTPGSPKATPKDSISDDRAVPTSPPIKLMATSTDNLTVQGSKGTVAGELLVAKTESKITDMTVSVVPQAETAKEPAGMDVDSVFGGSSESESENTGEKRANKYKLIGLVNSIYAENQNRAAEVQARLAEPFLSAYPTLIPGIYSSPTEWPFWAENEKTHEQIKPRLVKILAREKVQEQSHARHLQEEYSTLYAKWRKRVDKLDRQREAKQRGASGGPAVSSNAQTAFGAMSHRRRTAGAPTLMTTDEFGFSLGPLFSASANPSHHIDAGGRLDDSLFTSDAVNSEAELQAIIERLQHDDARNPDLRSQRTAATIPDMVTDPKQRQMLRFNNNSHLVTDPLVFYHVRQPEPGSSEYQRIAYSNNGDSNHYWTQNEVSAFVTAYLTYPKEFGKIAAHIPHKSMNDCVLFYYRNKKQLKLKDLEAKSLKRARRSRQAGTSGGGSSGRRRKDRARERRERKAREERERMAMEAAAECAPADHSAFGGVATPADEGIATNARTSAMPSEDEGAVSATGSLQLSAEASDILERRSKSSALLRSIIAANRQRKREAVMEGASLLGLDDNVAGIDEIPPIVSPTADATPLPVDEEDEELEEELEDGASLSTSLHSFAKVASPSKSRLRADEPFSESAASSLPHSVPVSAVSTRTRRDVTEEGAMDSNGADDEDMVENTKVRRGAGSDDEEEGELVEDTHWEPRRRSRQPSELNAYAMGGSIVRTRRTREIEQASAAYQSDSNSDDNYSLYRSRRARRRSSVTSAFGEDEEEIVEISGVVASSDRSTRPRIVSRRSQSRFGAMFTAVLDPKDNEVASVGNDGDADGALAMLRQRSVTPLSPGVSADWQAKSHLDSSPKESAQDRYVADEPDGLRRPLSSYETLMMCLSATNPLSSPVSGAPSHPPHTPEVSGKTPTQLRRQLEVQVDEEAGEQESVLVGAAVWLREDRRRVLRGFHKLGADFAQVASLMPSKTTAQCRYFYYHYRTPGGALISESFGSGSAAVHSVEGRQPSVDSLVLPPSTHNQTGNNQVSHSQTDNSQTGASSLALPAAEAKPWPTSRSVSERTGSVPLLENTAGPGVKRSRSKSPYSSSDDDDDEMPLAAQLAEELAAQAALERSHPSTPTMAVSGQTQRRASDIMQVRPEMLNPRVTPIASLVLPQKQNTPISEMPLSASSVNMSGPLSSTSSVSVAVSGRTSPHSPGHSAATAKKSGYSSYWSVHERSAFMHYVVRLGQNWQKLAEAIGSKTGTQVRNYFRANREKLGLDLVVIEYERNKAAGTVPEMVQFQAGSMAKDEVKKEKRGRKRKTEVAKSPVAGSSGSGMVPSTAPANVTNFPTMGVDGGRAVVYARPPKDAVFVRPQGPAQGVRPQQTWARPPPHNMALPSHNISAHSLPPQNMAHNMPYPGQHRYSLPPVSNIEAEPRIGSVARDESNTPMSQPTPPPVDGLPRFSSSPAPAQPSSALHISNLTNGPRFAQPDEPRKPSVSKINALLNSEPSQSPATSWFDEPTQEDEATGIAALALASMGARAEARHAYLPPTNSVHRPSDPVQPVHNAPSAFSPVVSRPQSVDPAYACSPRARVMSPAPHQGSLQGPIQRQRKPSAPPLPPSGSFVRPFVGYAGQIRPVFPHASSPQVQTPVYQEEYRGFDAQRAYSTGQQVPRPAYYYPMSPSQQQQHPAQHPQHPPQQQHPQHPPQQHPPQHPPTYPGYQPPQM
ncbi:DNA-binding protein snt1 [Coemansia sp. RSA 720]|nr:DNA-binding protein snt1 [Coemansia sp. RSA 720]